jgi:hypothetical protein
VGAVAVIGRTEPETADLSDVIAVAVLMARHAADVPALEAAVAGLPSTARLGLDEARTMSVMRESATEVKALSEALGS